MTIKKTWVAAAALLATSTGALADGTYDFDSVTSISRDGTTLIGVLVNDTAPTTLTLSYNGFRDCKEWLELTMKQPGMFTLSVTVISLGGDFPTTYISACTLTAK